MCCNLKKFCGKFEDKHHEADVDASEEDLDGGKERPMLPKDYDKIVKAGKAKGLFGGVLNKVTPPSSTHANKLLAQNEAMAVKAWVQYQKKVPVEEAVKGGGGGTLLLYADAIVVADQKSITEGSMIKKLRTFQSLHTIEIVHCGLKECPGNLTDIESLRVLRLSRNLIRCVRKDLTRAAQGKYSSLHRIIMDENRIDMIELGALGAEAVKDVVVINFGKNQLPMLPIDFCMKASNLEFLDLSFNKLESLPDSIVECPNLRLLDVCNNQLKCLPARIDKLKKLRKLFVNSNHLTEIPSTIGDCKALEKFWVSGNYLLYLPESIIGIWRTEPGGCLEEIMVDDNPLVVPSVTAFQMGGPDQMFRLFKEFVEEEKRRKQEQALKMLELEGPQDGGQMALRDVAAPGDGDMDMDIAADEGHASAPRIAAEAHSKPAEIEDDAYATTVDKPVVEAEREVVVQHVKKQETDYYFESVKHDFAKMSEIRSAESSMLLLKRQLHCDQLKELAKATAMEAKKTGEKIPKKVEKYLKDDFSVQQFRGTVGVMDLDIYFCLLVISAKPLCATCEQLYNKFTPNGDMDRKAWDYFTARIPAKLPDEAKSAMWRLLNWRNHDNDEPVQICDFIAALHIHDIALRDPFIQRVSQVLKLQYYNLPMDEFETKIRRRGNDTANALESIDFPSDDEPEPGDAVKPSPGREEDDAVTYVQHEGLNMSQDRDFIPIVEGERHMAHSDQEALQRLQGSKAKTDGKKRRPMISMSDAQYCQIHNSGEAEEEEEHVNAFEISSDELSLQDGSDSSFDADDCLEVIEQLGAASQMQAQTEVPKQQFQIKTEADLSQLMNLPTHEILGITPQNERNEGPGPSQDAAADRENKKKKAVKEREKKKQKQMAGATMVRDTRFGTNMMTVRRALRDAYRNLPYDDFVALVNFLLRGLKHIKHYDASVHITYWHADDPVVRHLMGSHDTNKYPAAILTEMGFVCVFGLYWIWPDKHMTNVTPQVRDRLVPLHCLGLEKMRLDDLIKLVGHCRKSLDKAGKKFTGHCRGS